MDMESAICRRLVDDSASRAWQLAERTDVGRYLIAARDLADDEIVFTEKPLVVARSMSEGEPVMQGEMVAVAMALLREPEGSPACLLQEADFSADSEGLLAGNLRTWTLGVLRALKAQRHTPNGSAHEATEEAMSWALSVASVNVHGGLTPARGVLGLLASMMEHSCSPSARTDVSSEESGSVVTLRTKRPVKAGESLSISYVMQDAPVHERRRQLRLQHGFVCTCERCAQELAAPVGGDEGESQSWKQAWETRAWCGVDPYSGQ